MNNIANMKWHGLYVTVTAFILITLPIKGFGEHCRADTWNKALKSQQKVEDWYNTKAERFNQLLKLHHQQTFLHKAFSEQEITSFWRPEKHALHYKMNQQIRAANTVVQSLNQEVDALTSESAIIDNAISMWEGIHRHCKVAQYKLNSFSSLTYIQLNQTLRNDTQILLRKIERFRRIYQQEIEALKKNKP